VVGKLQYRDDTMNQPPGSGAPTLPPLSIVMPVRNEARHLADAVQRVLAQDYPAPVEVVLAVGPSQDRTQQIAEGLAAADPRVTVVLNPRGDIPVALNLAVKTARHAVIARVDGHALLPDGYLRVAVATLQETGADGVGGVMAAEGVTAFERAVAWGMTSKFGVGSASNHTGGEAGPAPTVYLGVYQRASIEKVGGYDEAYLRAEEWEMNLRIRQAGGLLWFQPLLEVTYRPRGTVRALAAQYFHYGRWRRVVAREHAGTINLRYLAPPLALSAVAAGTAAGLVGLFAGVAGPAPALAWLTAGFVLPAGYLAGLLGITALASRSLPPKTTARLPVVLATMHMFWGAGFLTSPRGLMPARRRRMSTEPGDYRV
jgi:succinoglycan biosynthesis protein ExoA